MVDDGTTIVHSGDVMDPGGVLRGRVLDEEAFSDPVGYEAWFSTPLGAFVDDLDRGALGRVLEGSDPGVVVDVGAGTGHFVGMVAQRHRVIAVEPSEAMRTEGRLRTAGSTVRWCAGVGEHLPLASASVDGVIFMATLEWAPDPRRCAAEARRVVRPGGWLVIGFLSALSPWAALYRHRADEGAEPWQSARFFSRADVETLVGARAVRAEGVAHLAPQAFEPWPEADEAGRRAGNNPAMEVLRWDLTN
jgi:ubiquinone/menaquinone biosynthesis C-methylase UbiE